VPCLAAWAESLGGITYPLLSDFYPHGGVASLYGVLRPEGSSERAIFVVDKWGMIRFSKIYPDEQQPDNEELFRAIAVLEPELTHRWELKEAAQAPVPEKPLPQGVVLYCTPWCPECRRVRVFLNRYGIPFSEVDITRDRAAAQRVRGWTGGPETTPALSVNGQIQIGFKEARLADALGITLE
jgi:glutaredoxin